MSIKSVGRSTVTFVVWIAILAWIQFAPAPYFSAAIGYYVFAFIVLLALPLPLGLSCLIAATLFLLNGALNAVSKTKAALTEMPLLLPDLLITMRNPYGLLNSVKFSPALFFGTIAIATALFLALLFWLSRRHIRKHGWPDCRAGTVFVASLLAFAITYDRYADRLYHAAKPPSKILADAWVPGGLAAAARSVGVFAFLTVTHRIESAGTGNLLSTASNNTVAQNTPGDGYAQFVKKKNGPGKKPNIVFLLLESTFDVNSLFDISPPLRTTFSQANEGAAAGGSLFVNAIGGGTWITEFETIAGIDSRLFGLSGLYTHVSLSPKIKNTFATYLRDRGYDTLALYPIDGKFYGARPAYKNYGFENFLDARDLKQKNLWFFTDEELIKKYVQAIQPEKNRPFFVYGLTIANHSPHPCKNFGSGKLPHVFVREKRRDLNCQLNEYIARQKDTERAVDVLETHLRGLEKKTGRPYVLVIFGDHLPNAFVGANGAVLLGSLAYDHLRRQPKNQTFYQIRSSAKGRLRVGNADISPYLLPTLVSTYVAKDKDDAYLGVNFDVAHHCGAQLPLSVFTFHYRGRIQNNKESNSECKKSIAVAATVYKKEILRPE